MSKTQSQPNHKSNHKADQSNGNKGTSGTNPTYDAVQGNRGKQKNPNNKK